MGITWALMAGTGQGCWGDAVHAGVAYRTVVIAASPSTLLTASSTLSSPLPRILLHPCHEQLRSSPSRSQTNQVARSISQALLAGL